MLGRLLAELWGRRRARAPADASAGAAAAHVSRAETLRKRGDLDGAIAAYREALYLDNEDAEAWFGLGLCCFRAGDLPSAHLYLRTASSRRPRDADILNELGLVDHAFGNLSSAQDTFEHAVNANPDHPEAWSNLGLVHAARGRVRQAKRCFLRAVSIRPDFYTAVSNLGLAYAQLEMFAEAEHHLRAAIALRDDLPDAWLNLGTMLQDLGRLDEARAALEAAAQRSRGGEDARVALAGVLQRLGEGESAEREYRAALAREPANAEAGLGLAQLLLGQARFAEGWDLYEARLKARASPARPFPYPACDGRPAGRRTLVYGEQGIGDEILFASCLPDLLREAARCFLVCNPRLAPLLRRSFPTLTLLEEGAAMSVRTEPEAQRIDCCLPIGSLPRLYRRAPADFPRHSGYLVADAERMARWRERLATLGGARRFGIGWRGGRASTGRALRSLAAESLAPILRTPGVAWVSLQHGASAEELVDFARSAGAPIHHWPEALADLDETAALLCALDGTVTASSTIVHLGGALGRPVRVLAPFAASWRYLSEGTGLPWYPSVRVYRQARRDDWSGAVDALAEELGS